MHTWYFKLDVYSAKIANVDRFINRINGRDSNFKIYMDTDYTITFNYNVPNQRIGGVLFELFEFASTGGVKVLEWNFS